MGKPMQYYERTHDRPLHLEDEFTNRDYAMVAAKQKRSEGHRVALRKKNRNGIVRYQLWTDE